MKKRGLHFIWLLVLIVALTGCGSGGNNNSAKSANTAGAPMANADTKSDSGDQASTSEAAPVDSGDATKVGEGKQDSSNSQNSGTNLNTTSVGFTGSDIVAGLNKKLIYHANLNMEVKDYAKAQTDIRNIISLTQGYIIGFTETMSEVEQGGTFIVKVPASGLSSFLNKLEGVKHESIQRNIEGKDVSEEYVDLGSRLKAKQLMEAQYIEFMKKATKSSDLVAFANELGSIQESIEQIKGRMRYIDQNVSFSTVELRLYQTDASITVQKQKEQGPLLDRASDALTGSLHVLSTMFQWLVVILAGALPVLVGLGIILAMVLVYRKTGRNRPKDPERQERIEPDKEEES